MGAPDLLHTLQDRGLRLWADGDRLMVAPRARITDDTRALIRSHKTELLNALGTGDLPVQVDDAGHGCGLGDSMTHAEATEIRAWLARIEETDPAIITYVLHSCRTDSGARAYFLRHAAGDYATVH